MKSIILLGLLFWLSLPTVSSAAIDAGGFCANNATGFVGLEVNLDPGDTGTYYVSRIQFAVVSQPDEGEWTAAQPYWLDDPGNALDWTVSVQPLHETGLSAYHSAPLTGITWTAHEPLLMDPYPNMLRFSIQMRPGRLTTDWSVFRIWGGSGGLIYMSDFAPLADPAPDTPEPSALVVLGCGFAAVLWLCKQHRQVQIANGGSVLE